MLMVGSSGRNTGKTDLACALAARFGAGRPLLAVKVTTVQDRNNVCPRGGKGCGVCTSLEDTHSIVEEKNAGNRKDTERLLAAGAQKVLWLRVMKEHLREGASALLECIGPESLTICESNSLRTVVEPAVFLMVQGSDQMEWKASAEAVREYVDRHVTFNGDRFDLDPDDVGIVDGSWAVRLEASAVILAGGRGARMGRDKGSLPVGKRTMLEHIAAQLAPHFEQLLVSTKELRLYFSSPHALFTSSSRFNTRRSIASSANSIMIPLTQRLYFSV